MTRFWTCSISLASFDCHLYIYFSFECSGESDVGQDGWADQEEGGGPGQDCQRHQGGMYHFRPYKHSNEIL